MLIQGVTLREKAAIEKNKLYAFSQSKTIHYVEEKSGNVDIEYCLADGQMGYYVHEYRPATVPQHRAKKTDITAFVIDEVSKRVKGYIYEVKKSVGGKNIIFDLCEQWLAGVKYWRHGVVAYLEECMIEEEIGVFTENFEPSRIKTEIDRLERANMSCEPEKIPPLILGKMNIEKLKRTQELEVLRDFVEYQFTYKEGMASEKLSFKVRTLDGKKEHYLRLEV